VKLQKRSSNVEAHIITSQEHEKLIMNALLGCCNCIKTFIHACVLCSMGVLGFLGGRMSTSDVSSQCFVLCQCTSFDVEAFDLFFFPNFFVNSLNIIANLSPKLASQLELKTLQIVHERLLRRCDSCLGVAMAFQNFK
jgi:hypothetical protein